MSLPGTVSIHVPLAEHDDAWRYSARDMQSFNSRAPRGARLMLEVKNHLRLKFQFTCPSRSTTTTGFGLCRPGMVSIHVPLAEHDLAPRR